jgi:hypothetical protein
MNQNTDDISPSDPYDSRPLTDLAPNPKNPRRISDFKLNQLRVSLDKFGDLSGVVFNRRSGKLICGHQRMKWLAKNGDNVTYTRRYEEPTPTGTVADGYITVLNERFSYREVDWDGERESQGMVAANKLGGDWDERVLHDTLKELDASAIEITGFTSSDLTRMLGSSEKLEKSDIVPELLESYDYVVIITKNDTERAALHTLLDIKKVAGYKGPEKLGVGRVVTFPDFRSKINL